MGDINSECECEFLNEGKKRMCSICFEDTDGLFRLQCSHEFHAKCILSWYAFSTKTATECPNCKTILQESDVNQMLEQGDIVQGVITIIKQKYDQDAAKLSSDIQTLHLQSGHRFLNKVFIPKFSEQPTNTSAQKFHAAIRHYTTGILCLHQQLQIARDAITDQEGW